MREKERKREREYSMEKKRWPSVVRLVVNSRSSPRVELLVSFFIHMNEVFVVLNLSFLPRHTPQGEDREEAQ